MIPSTIRSSRTLLYRFPLRGSVTLLDKERTFASGFSPSTNWFREDNQVSRSGPSSDASIDEAIITRQADTIVNTRYRRFHVNFKIFVTFFIGFVILVQQFDDDLSSSVTGDPAVADRWHEGKAGTGEFYKK